MTPAPDSEHRIDYCNEKTTQPSRWMLDHLYYILCIYSQSSTIYHRHVGLLAEKSVPQTANFD